MITSAADERIKEVRTTDDELIVAFVDGRTLSVPLVWYPRLLHASPEQRRDWRLIGGGEGIHWPQIDEDLSAAGLLRGVPAPAVRPQSSPAKEIQEQALSSAKDFYGNTLGQVKGRLESSRSQLQDLQQQLPDPLEEARVQIQELIDSYESIENALDEAAQTQGVEDTVNLAVQQVQEAAQGAVGQTVERTVDESGNIYERILNVHGEVIGEDLVGNVADLPVEEEYIDDQGRGVSRVKDASGNVFEQVFDDQGNVVEVRGALPSNT